jgi:pSer/pThr/pTyr-binding forkhead associated (FHA) protein
MRSWIIGSKADCDVVVDSPMASGRHCKLTQSSEGYFLEDLGSTNGTYIDGNRITASTRVTLAQQITLGHTVPMPWPNELAKVIRVGRVAGNDIVLDDPRVSGQHARLIIVGGSHALLEDLGSSNGTFLNSVDTRVTRPTPISPSDTVYFGSLAVPAARLLEGLPEGVAPVSAPISNTPVAAKGSSAAPVASRPAFAIAGNRWLLVALAQVPLLAILIVLSGGRHTANATAEDWKSVGQGIAAASFGLSAAAVWLGCSIAVAAIAGGLWPVGRAKGDAEPLLLTLGSHLAIPTAACAFGCALLLAIVYLGAGLQGPWLFMAGLLVIASLTGMLLGLLISSVARSWQVVAVVLIGGFAFMIALGGWVWPIAGKGLPASLVTGATPTRWAFEGLFLLEWPHHVGPVESSGPLPAPDRDPVEEFFRATSERMGPQADAMALGSMLLGLAAAVAVTSTKPRQTPGEFSLEGTAGGRIY